MASAKEDVYCTLVMTDSYLPGAAVLAHSLRDNGTKKKLAVLVTVDSLRATTMTELKSLYDYVIPVDRIGNSNPANLYLMNRGDLLYAFTKINLWRQTQFRKIVYLDADVVALRAPDELFDLQASFAGAPDVGWPDAFNTGVMVLTPHMGDFWALQTLAATGDSFDGADQGLLNQYYEHKDWHRLSFIYNCTPSANYQYEPAYRYHKARISVVHFIGKDKPWNAARSRHAAPGAYNELLFRWWAVYDRHFREPTSNYASGQYSPASSTPPIQASAETTMAQPEASLTTTEYDPADPGDLGEQLAQGLVEPTSTTEQRRFSAPQAEWDATRSAPPSHAKPEASNFPTQVYAFNEDKELFRAPAQYPEPPKGMWYEVPESKPLPPKQKPAPIFPWEEREPAKPTRKFLEDPSPEPSPPINTAVAASDFASPPNFPVTPTIRITHDDPWQAFGSVAKNAWDDVAGIDKYVRALGKSQQKSPKKTAQQQPNAQGETSFERRESLILTDFPSEIDRPSLPVTPAPIRRPTFWAGERNDEGQLPSADGVPHQADWDPSVQLEELRRNSASMPLDLKMPDKKLPTRAMPPSAVTVSEGQPAGAPTAAPLGGGGSPHGLGLSSSAAPSAASSSRAPPQFSTPSFAAANSNAKEEDILSPTEHGSRHF